MKKGKKKCKRNSFEGHFLLLLTDFETFCRETEQINDHYRRAFSWVDQQFLIESHSHACTSTGGKPCNNSKLVNSRFCSARPLALLLTKCPVPNLHSHSFFNCNLPPDLPCFLTSSSRSLC
jgi:hypothetical protein